MTAIAGLAAAAVAAEPADQPAPEPAIAPPEAVKAPPPPDTMFAEPAAASVQLSATLGPSDDLKALLIRTGASKADAAAAAKLVATALPAGIPDGVGIDLTLALADNGDGKRVERIGFKPSPAYRVMIGRNRAGELKLARENMIVDATPQRFHGRAGTNLFWSLRAAGVPAEAAHDYLQALSGKVDRGASNPEDEFDLVLDSMRGADGQARLGTLLYAGYRSSAGRQFGVVRWTVDGQSGWFDPANPQQNVPGFRRPVSGTVTSAFGYRIHPILRFARFHQGVDIGAASGTPVFAAADGIVAGAGWNGGHGRQVRLVHPDGISTSYSHLSAILATPGTRVHRGQLVGLVGSTGFSTGAHLHFEVRRNGQPVDPLTFHPAGTQSLDGNDVAAIRARLVQLRSI